MIFEKNDGNLQNSRRFKIFLKTFTKNLREGTMFDFDDKEPQKISNAWDIMGELKFGTTSPSKILSPNYPRGGIFIMIFLLYEVQKIECKYIIWFKILIKKDINFFQNLSWLENQLDDKKLNFKILEHSGAL